MPSALWWFRSFGWGLAAACDRRGQPTRKGRRRDERRGASFQPGPEFVVPNGAVEFAVGHGRAPRDSAASPGGAGQADEVAQAMKREAFDLGQQALRDFPQSTSPLVLMARLYQQFGDLAEAVRWWQQVLDRSLAGPTADQRRAAAACTQMGVIAAQGGDHEQAAGLFRKASELDPRQTGVHQRLGHALLELGRPEEAARALEEELRQHPQAAAPYTLLGQAYLDLQQPEQAVASYEKALAERPHDSKACYGLAIAHTPLGQKDQARSYQDRFRQLCADDDRRSRLQRQSMDELDWMRRAVAPMHRHAGEIYLENRRLTEAQRHLQRAAELDPRDQLCRQKLVDLYMSQRRPADALPWCEQLRQLDSQSANYQLNAGVMLAALRRFDEAEEALRKGIALRPERADAYYSLVQVLLYGTKKPADAQATAEKLVQLAPRPCTTTCWHWCTGPTGISRKHGRPSSGPMCSAPAMNASVERVNSCKGAARACPIRRSHE